MKMIDWVKESLKAMENFLENAFEWMEGWFNPLGGFVALLVIVCVAFITLGLLEVMFPTHRRKWHRYASITGVVSALVLIGFMTYLKTDRHFYTVGEYRGALKQQTQKQEVLQKEKKELESKVQEITTAQELVQESATRLLKISEDQQAQIAKLEFERSKDNETLLAVREVLSVDPEANIIEKIRAINEDSAQLRKKVAELVEERSLDPVKEKIVEASKPKNEKPKHKEIIPTPKNPDVVPEVFLACTSKSTSALIAKKEKEKDKAEAKALEMARLIRVYSFLGENIKGVWSFDYLGKSYMPTYVEVPLIPGESKEKTNERLRKWATEHPARAFYPIADAHEARVLAPIPHPEGSKEYAKYIFLRQKMKEGLYPRYVGVPPTEKRGDLSNEILFSETFLEDDWSDNPALWIVPPPGIPEYKASRECYEMVARIVGWPIIK